MVSRVVLRVSVPRWQMLVFLPNLELPLRETLGSL